MLSLLMCPSGGPREPASEVDGGREFSVPLGHANGVLRILATTLIRTNKTSDLRAR